jgi:hypothetical protein
MQMTLLDNGHYIISEKDAKKLNNGSLPRQGFESLVAHDGKHWWLARAWDQGRCLWTIRDAGRWRLVDGQAVLGGN